MAGEEDEIAVVIETERPDASVGRTRDAYFSPFVEWEIATRCGRGTVSSTNQRRLESLDVTMTSGRNLQGKGRGKTYSLGSSR